MAKYKGKYRKRYRKYRRWYKKYKNIIKPINNTSRSRCCIKSRATYSDNIVIPAASNFSDVYTFNPFIVRGAIGPGQEAARRVFPFSTVDQPTTRVFCELYDEIKVDAVVFKVTVTTPVGLGAGFDALRVWTGWDRKGTYGDVYTASKYPTYVSVVELPSCQATMMANNTVNTFYRYCKASDFFEKFCYMDATQAVNPAVLNGVQVSNCTMVDGWGAPSGALPGFSPSFYLCLETVNYAPLSDLNINVAFEMTTYYSYRNPKFAGTSYSSKVAMKSADVPGVDDALVQGMSPAISSLPRLTAESGNLPGLSKVKRRFRDDDGGDNVVVISHGPRPPPPEPPGTPPLDPVNAPDVFEVPAPDPAAPPASRRRVSFAAEDAADEPDMEQAPVDDGYISRFERWLTSRGVPVAAIGAAVGTAVRLGMPYIRAYMGNAEFDAAIKEEPVDDVAVKIEPDDYVDETAGPYGAYYH